MKGTGRLIRNEVMKITHQIAWKIIAIVILVLAIINPLITGIINNVTLGYDDAYLDVNTKNYEREEEGSIDKEYFGVRMKVSEYFVNNGISGKSWRYNEFEHEYTEACVILRGMELLKEGRNVVEVDKHFFYSESLSVYEDDYSIVIIDGEDFITITPETVDGLIESKKAEIAEIEDKIVNSTVESYAQLYVTQFSLKAGIEEQEYEAAKAAYESDPEKLFDYQAAEYNLFAARAARDIWKAISQSGREDEEWMLAAGQLVYSYIDQGINYAAVTETQFNADEQAKKDYLSYESYYKIRDKKLHDRVAALEIIQYSVENGKPLPSVYQGSSKTVFDSSVVSNAEIILLFCMVLAATVIASEYSSGSIRLLVIRPRARWKILFSKICAMVIYGLVMFVLSSIVSFIVTIIVSSSGVGDIFVPAIIHRHGVAKEVPSIIYIVLKTLYSSLPGIFFVSISLFLAVAMRKIVFAIAIPMVLNTFSSIVSTITLAFGTNGGLFRYTLLPYFIIEGYTADVVTRTSGFAMFDFIELGYEPEHGLIMFLIHIALFVALSFIIFRRQEIKN